MKRIWDKHRDNVLRLHYSKANIEELAARLGVTPVAAKSRAYVLGLRRNASRKPWTERQINFLRKHYADMTAEEIAVKTSHTKYSVLNMARKLGLKKSREFLQRWGHHVNETAGSRRHRFQKGHVPANKGKRMEEYMSEDAIERVRKNQFKKGRLPHNTRDVGTDCVHADGYVYHKTKGGTVAKHRLIWSQHHGEVPEGYVVAFRDGNRQNCDIGNLYLLSREDNARRRVLEETPEARAMRMGKVRDARNKSIRMDKIRIHFGLEPRTKLVKKW